MHNNPKYLAFTLLALPMLLSGCLNEDTQPQPEQSVTGRIVLSLSNIEVYVDAQTRSTQPLSDFSDFVFTLDGVTDEGVDVDNQVVTFESSTDGDGNPIAIGYFDAGTYTLSANNLAASQDGNGCAYYAGTSTSFHFGEGATANVTLNLGSPQNAKIQLSVETSFSTLYATPTVTLDPSGRSASLTTVSPAYFPVGMVNYTISAAAKSGSHVTDISGVPGSITVEAGKAYTLTLKADPVTGILIPVVSGMHTGEFD